MEHRDGRDVTPDRRRAPHLKVPPLTLPTVVRQGVLGSGETLGELWWGGLGFRPPRCRPWLSAVRRQIDPRALPVGLVAEAVFDVHGSVKALRLTPDWRSTVVVERSGGDAGRPARGSSRRARPRGRARAPYNRVCSTPCAPPARARALAVALADLFQWDIDFHREVRSGDTFALLVERVRREGTTVAYGPVVAATYDNRGKRYTAVRYAFAGGRRATTTSDGRPLRKQFLSAPLQVLAPDLALLLSPGCTRSWAGRLPHWGVDYGAPVGTPVMTTADGVVTFTGWRGGGGNTVEVRHAGAT